MSVGFMRIWVFYYGICECARDRSALATHFVRACNQGYPADAPFMGAARSRSGEPDPQAPGPSQALRLLLGQG